MLPNIISSTASLGMSLNGVLRAMPLLARIASICQNIIWFLNFPKGTIAPSAMLSVLSGITFSMSISLTHPSPLQCGQAPSGELNENMFGAGSLYAIPVTGSMSFFEKLRDSPLSLSSMTIAPSPCLMAVSMLFRNRSPSPSLTSILSITTSILWFL